jgi:hypothetical protein
MLLRLDSIQPITLRASALTHKKDEDGSKNARSSAEHAEVLGAGMDRNLRALNVKRIGNDGSPANAFPLGLFQGFLNLSCPHRLRPGHLDSGQPFAC